MPLFVIILCGSPGITVSRPCDENHSLLCPFLVKTDVQTVAISGSVMAEGAREDCIEEEVVRNTSVSN